MNKETKVEVPREQMETQLNEHLRFLQKSANEYDLGDFAEARRMATEICKLIGDRYGSDGKIKESSRSLTHRLDVKPSEMIDLSIPGVFELKQLYGPVTTMAFSLSSCYGFAPVLDGFVDYPDHWQPRMTPFEIWWNAPVIRDSEGNVSSRGQVLFHMRDKESVHTDGAVAYNYAALSNAESFGIGSIHTKPAVLDNNVARVIVRQAAHELLRTIVPDYPKRYSFGPPLLVQPISLIEYCRKNDDGSATPIEALIQLQIKHELTSDATVWANWQQISASTLDSYNLFGMPQKKMPATSPTGREIYIRLALVNYAPYAISGVKVMIGQ